jgi:DNA-directed RNA polymerase specialized sigma24 family protein
MPLADISEALDIPLGTVKSRLHYAAATLRAAIEADARTTSSPPRGERLA